MESGDVTESAVIEAETQAINDLAKQTQLQYVPAYQPFTPKALITSVLGLVNAGRILQVSDKVIYRATGQEVEISRTVSFAPNILEKYLTPDPERQRQTAVVVIKKPDYLGDSQWELRLDGRTIRAHILDRDWLTSFRKRHFEIKPGDALRVILDISLGRSEIISFGELHYEVVEVLGIVPGAADDQQFLIE